MNELDAPHQTPPVHCTRCDTPLPAGQTSCPRCGTGAQPELDDDSIGLGLTRVQGQPETSIPLNLELIGETLGGRFVVERELGRGGMGRAWKAMDKVLKRNVVVKIPHPALLMDEQFRRRFQREVKRLIELRHPNVVRVQDTGSHRGLPYVVLEYLGGGNLASRLRKATSSGGKLSFQRIVEKLLPIAGALDFMHKQDVIHRDVKPENILFDEHGYPFLADFGIAKALTGDTQQLTGTGLSPGTPAYMAPEQATGKHLSGAADQYALGIVLYEITTGTLPFSADTPMEALIQKHSVVPEPVHERNPEVPQPAAFAIGRALSKDPGARHPSCTSFLESVLRGLRGEALPEVAGVVPPLHGKGPAKVRKATPPPPPPSKPRPKKRQPAPEPEAPREPRLPSEPLVRGERVSPDVSRQLERPLVVSWLPRMERALRRGQPFPVVAPVSILIALAMVAIAGTTSFGFVRNPRTDLFLTGPGFHGEWLMGLSGSIALLLVLRMPAITPYLNLGVLTVLIVDTVTLEEITQAGRAGDLSGGLVILFICALTLLVTLFRTVALWSAWQTLRRTFDYR